MKKCLLSLVGGGDVGRKEEKEVWEERERKQRDRHSLP